MQEDSALKSPVREQGIQTEMPDLPTNFVREDSAGIEFKVNNQKKEQKDNRTVKEDYRERSRSRVKDKFERRVRSPSPVYEEIPQRKKHMKISERPQWGSTAPGKKSRKASDRDLTIDRRKKEERLRKRQEQLLIMQEMNTRHRLMRERTPSPPIPAVQSRMRSYSPGNRSPAKPIRYESPTGRRTRHRSYSPTGQHTKQSHVSTPPNPDHPASPPVKTGDFAPFMRSEAHQLIPDSLPPTPNEPKHRQRYSQDNHEERYPKKRDKRTEQEKDPLLNPERLKDSELRQEMILKQLSHLRQGLILKQREMEVGMTPLIH
ncbi:coiled-coil domain-containing protein 66-like [Saccoglossus kowalevskii]|uniref:Coiled-coil domain-containing protein 66-like n=1 Tax=Saccoglossus kowalevskii TaxID=10224 RepID=A0ABM0M9F9_SACKO|nr:PREDICTED: coiled-coil domain-containing protein 66-like [Saccoglossus kowalevskii]